MKVLISAYACSPYSGSERAVGWKWVEGLGKFHELTVLVSSDYEDDIMKNIEHKPFLKKIEFIFINVNASKWHVNYRFERFYYLLWQKKAYKIAKKLVASHKYDIIHHVTYATNILPSYLHKLSVPFILGPVGGGENIPTIIEYPMSVNSKLTEFIRSSVQRIAKRTMNYHSTLRNASIILVTTNETKKMIPGKYHYKTKIMQTISLNEDQISLKKEKKIDKKIRFLIVGRMIYWKGFQIAIDAFSEALEECADIELTVIADIDDGNSKLGRKINDLVQFNKNKISINSNVNYAEMMKIYDTHDVLINCSLRDSGCLVIMEAMGRGLATICINTGGPKVNTTSDNSLKIEPTKYDELVTNVSKAIIKLAKDKELVCRLSENALMYAQKEFSISVKVERMNELYVKYGGSECEKNCLYDSTQ